MKSYRLQKLNERFTQEGVQGLFDWAARWMYWNGGGVHVARAIGRAPKKFGVRNPIVVYQMGKVGSSSVFHSLVDLKLDVPVYHLHILEDFDEMAYIVSHVDPNREVAPRMLETGRAIRREMAENPQQGWNFISLVRLPIPRQISAFFESAIFIFPKFQERMNAGNLHGDELADFFLYQFKEEWPLWWFEKQMHQPFGIDVYATLFDKARGYQLYKHNNVHLLLMRLEDLNRVAGAAMDEFFHIPNFQLTNKNVGEQKFYRELYREFLDALKLPSAYVDKWHNSRYAKHFYTPQELEASIARWVR